MNLIKTLIDIIMIFLIILPVILNCNFSKCFFFFFFVSLISHAFCSFSLLNYFFIFLLYKIRAFYVNKWRLIFSLLNSNYWCKSFNFIFVSLLADSIHFVVGSLGETVVSMFMKVSVVWLGIGIILTCWLSFFLINLCVLLHSLWCCSWAETSPRFGWCAWLDATTFTLFICKLGIDICCCFEMQTFILIFWHMIFIQTFSALNSISIFVSIVTSTIVWLWKSRLLGSLKKVLNCDFQYLISVITLTYLQEFANLISLQSHN